MRRNDAVRTWQMPSSTNPAKKYDITLYADGEFWCTCMRWRNKPANVPRACPHVNAIREVFKLQQTDAEIDRGRKIANSTGKRFISRAPGDI